MLSSSGTGTGGFALEAFLFSVTFSNFLHNLMLYTFRLKICSLSLGSKAALPGKAAKSALLQARSPVT